MDGMILIIISMNKQNQFVGGFSLWSKSSCKKGIEPDNSILSVSMPENIQKQIRESHEQLEIMFESYLQQISAFDSGFEMNQEFCLVQSEEELRQAQQRVSGEKLVFIKIFEQNHRSFKGFATWISITTSHQTYLIDLMSLRKAIESAPIALFSNPGILKVGIHMKQQIFALQRDFKIFMATVLDLNQLLSLSTFPSDLKSLVKMYFPSLSVSGKASASFYKRPCSNTQLLFLSACSQVLPSVLSSLRKSLAENKTLLEAFLMSNKLCLNVFECKLSKFSEQFQETLKHLNPKQERICRKLLKWRVHTARIRDQSPQFILSSHLIHSILKRNLKSMGELLSLYDEFEQKDVCRDYDQTILDIINSQSSKIDITKCQNDVNQCKSLNDFVRMIGWADSNWKNSNSDSIRLFKEIISMDPIESSIIENQLNETKNRILTNDEVIDLFGYVQYFTKNDPKGLQNQHQKFLKNYKNKSESEESTDPPVQKEFRIPQSIQEIYELANTKKKAMKKDKKKSIINEEKEEAFVLNAQEFLKSIGWN